mmetsp:Transcript_20897/g.37031  ORF Transcript_20897/g.37031 Transcript_20897/m.37031 type:complete len:85 (-) Transcript_20897:48-302(-)
MIQEAANGRAGQTTSTVLGADLEIIHREDVGQARMIETGTEAGIGIEAMTIKPEAEAMIEAQRVLTTTGGRKGDQIEVYVCREC